MTESRGAGAPGRAPKRFLYVERRAPHGSVYAQETLETILIGAAFDQRVRVLFLDDGVYQLRRGQRTEAIGLKNFAKAFGALPDYEVERVCVHAGSLEERGLGVPDLLIEVEVLDDAGVSALMEESEVILGA